MNPHWSLNALGVVAAFVATLLGSHEALCQPVISRFSLRGELGAGLVTSSLQRSALGYDGVHIQATGRVGFDLVDWLSLQVSVNNGVFFASGQHDNGRTLALQLGLRLQPAIGTLGRVWGDVNPGYYSAGADRRVGLDAGLGVEFNAGHAVALGPLARIHWIPADTAIHEASDAFYLSFGVSFSLRVPSAGASIARDRDRDHDRDQDGVLDGDDSCPSAPQGERPDPSRRGCPLADADADGVSDGDDQCANVPAGARPDLTRRGCPLTDQDSDGVEDADDQCPTTAAGPRPDPARRGCPIGDRDHDGIPDDVDRCPDRPETFNGRDDTDGCPDGAALSVRAGGRIRILEQIRFRSNSAEIEGARSFAIIAAVAAITHASPDILTVDVEGHTDDQGEVASNRDLSLQRAAAVVRELAARGIEPSRLTQHGYGSERPIAQGHSRRARAANRRIEFRVVLGDPVAPSAGAAPPAPPVPPTTPAPAPPPPAHPAGRGERRHHRHH